MLSKLHRALWLITNRDYIPKLPRGYLATKYNPDDVPPEIWRVLDRIGARDPVGIKRAMRKYQVDSIDELVNLLEHHQPRHRFRHRLKLACGRLLPNSYAYDPHEQEFKRAFKQNFEVEQYIKVRDRLRKVKKQL